MIFSDMSKKIEPIIAVHGGAWAIPENLWESSISGVKQAALEGFKVCKMTYYNFE